MNDNVGRLVGAARSIRSGARSIQVESLETRRLFAAWVLEVVRAPSEETSATYSYTIDEGGYHWAAELGDVGEAKSFDYGDRFHAYYDPNLPDHEGDAGPDHNEFYAGLLDRLQQEFAARNQGDAITFSIVEFADGTFEVAGAPARPPMDATVERPTGLAPPTDTSNAGLELDELLESEAAAVAPAPTNVTTNPFFAGPGSAIVGGLSDDSSTDDEDALAVFGVADL